MSELKFCVFFTFITHLMEVSTLEPLLSIVKVENVKENWQNRLPEIEIIPVIQQSLNSFYDTVDETQKKAENNRLKKSGYKNPFNYTQANKKKTLKIKEEKTENKNFKWSCMICLEVSPCKTSLIKHYEQHKNEKESKLVHVNQKIDSDYFVCPVCNKEFTSLKSYEKHADAVHGERKHVCEPCNKVYRNIFQLAVHNFNVHSNGDGYKCTVCDFSTKDKVSMKSHADEHKEESKYKCETCGKGFTSATWFEEHKNFHTGAMPFECEICSKSFPYTRYLVAHKKSMHPEIYSDVPVVHECHICQKRFAHKKSLILHIRGHTGENTVLCDMCGKRLSSAEHLKQHIRIHTGHKPYICGVCGKGFAKKCNLTLHERVHSGEKPYVCRVCTKCFSQRSTLVIHERYHSGERPYICRLCNRGFVAKGLLSVHMKSCTGLTVD